LELGCSNQTGIEMCVTGNDVLDKLHFDPVSTKYTNSTMSKDSSLSEM